jgi:hypothetical protein
MKNRLLKRNVFCAALRAALLSLPALSLNAQTMPADTVTSISLPVLEMDETLKALASYDSTTGKAVWAQLENQLGDPQNHPALEETLIRVINSQSTPDARSRACKMLAVVGTDKSTPVLGNLLRYGLKQNIHDVEIACFALAASSDPQAGEILRKVLAESLEVKSQDPAARVQIINALGTLRDRASVPALAQLAILENSDPQTATAAILALGRISNIEALNAVSEALARNVESPNLGVLNAGYEAIISQADLRRSDTLLFNTTVYQRIRNSRAMPDYIRCSALLGELRADSEAAMQIILSVLRSDDALLKPTAIAAIENLPLKFDSQPFLELFTGNLLRADDKSLLIRSVASRPDSYAQRIVALGLANPEPLIRRAAIESASQAVTSSAVLKGLVQALVESPDDQAAVAQTLLRLPKDDLVDMGLIQLLQEFLGAEPLRGNGPEAQAAKVTLIDALGKRGNPLASAALLLQSSSTDPATLKSSYLALIRTATASDLPRLTTTLLAIGDDTLRRSCAVYLAQFIQRMEDQNSAVGVLSETLLKGNLAPAQKATLVTLLSACPTPESLDRIVGLQNESLPALKDAVVSALASWPDSTVWKPLLNVFEASDTPTHRSQALRALLEIQMEENPKATADLALRYAALLKAANSNEEKKMILAALAQAAHPDTLALALSQLDNPAIAADARGAAERIAASLKTTHPEEANKALEILKAPSAN